MRPSSDTSRQPLSLSLLSEGSSVGMRERTALVRGWSDRRLKEAGMMAEMPGRWRGCLLALDPTGGTEVVVASIQLHHGEGAVAISDGGEHGEEQMEFEEDGGANAIL